MSLEDQELFKKLERKYYAIDWNGTKIYLTQMAYICGGDDAYYKASAIDEDFNEYTVEWDIRPEHIEHEYDDEGDACNWDEPRLVRKRSGQYRLREELEEAAE